MSDIKKIIREGILGKNLRLYTFLMGITIITGFMMLITFEYEDADSLAAWSLNFWDLLFKGKLDEFYEYTALNVHGAVHPNCGGNYLWLLPLCIWNLPLWVVHSIGGIVSIQNFWSICWSKMFLFILQIVTAHICGKICGMITSDKNRVLLTVLLVMASPEILVSVGYVGQDEIVYVCLFVAAFYYFLKGYWKRCYVMLVCCVTFCPIMLIPVLALLLLKEKRIYKLLIYITGTILPLFLFELCYKGDALYQSVKHTNDFVDMLHRMLTGSQFDTVLGAFSVVGVALCLLFFYCYMEQMPQDGNEEWHRKLVFLFALLFVMISFFMVDDFYRMFLYVPFLVVMLMTSGQDVGNNLFLFTILTYGRMFQVCRGSYPKSMNTCYVMRNSWITLLCDRLGSTRYLADPEHCTCLWAYVYSYGKLLEVLNLLVETCLVGVVVILFVMNRCGYQKQYKSMFRENVVLTICIACMPVVLLGYYVMLLH